MSYQQKMSELNSKYSLLNNGKKPERSEYNSSTEFLEAVQQHNRYSEYASVYQGFEAEREAYRQKEAAAISQTSSVHDQIIASRLNTVNTLKSTPQSSYSASTYGQISKYEGELSREKERVKLQIQMSGGIHDEGSQPIISSKRTPTSIADYNAQIAAAYDTAVNRNQDVIAYRNVVTSYNNVLEAERKAHLSKIASAESSYQLSQVNKNLAIAEIQGDYARLQGSVDLSEIKEEGRLRINEKKATKRSRQETAEDIKMTDIYEQDLGTDLQLSTSAGQSTFGGNTSSGVGAGTGSGVASGTKSGVGF